jgi:antitoxin (DNA-binding transcriptional repressor) of toxin-antitoxin stability system
MLVRLLALETPHGGPVTVLIPHQAEAQQDAMHRTLQSKKLLNHSSHNASGG